jgi:hypothetical protein
MSTQPVPTFPVVAGFEKYAHMTAEEIAKEYTIQNPDVLSLDPDNFKPTNNSDENYAFTDNLDGAVSFFAVDKKFEDIIRELVKLELDEDKDAAIRNSAGIFIHTLWEHQIAHLTK